MPAFLVATLFTLSTLNAAGDACANSPFPVACKKSSPVKPGAWKKDVNPRSQKLFTLIKKYPKCQRPLMDSHVGRLKTKAGVKKLSAQCQNAVKEYWGAK